MRKKIVFKEGIVHKQEETEVSTLALKEIPTDNEEVDGREIQIHLTAESQEGMKKRALVAIEAPGFSPFSLHCDEGTSMGGEDTAPAPLAYFAAAVAF